jgi:hypothetical protein
MAAQNELRWLLDTLVTAWPTAGSLGGSAPPETVAFRNRDEPETYYYPDTEPAGIDDYDAVREQAAPTDGFRTVGVASGAETREFYGNKPQYDVTTTLDVRVQEKSEFEAGAAEDVADHDTLVAYCQRAINTTITYPEVDPDADAIGRVVYLDAGITDTDRRSREFKDQFLTEFTVRLRGRQDTP